MAAVCRSVLRRILAAGVACHLVVALIGCGVKGPPVPARMPLVPPVVDLAATREGQRARLTWRIAQPLSRTRAESATFRIFRSRSTLDQAVCEGCPLVFESAMTVIYIDPEKGRFSATVPLEPGYRYTFKVRLEIGPVIGPSSNLATVEVLSRQPAESETQP